MDAPFDLSGRVALVTGSTRGIGLALARSLASAGATVVINGRSQDAAEQTASQLRNEGLSAVGHAFDVGDESAVTAAVEQIESTVGPIEVLVNNAGIQKRGPMLDYAVDDFRRLLDTNLIAAFIVAKAVGARMVGRGRGKIVNVCSVNSTHARATIVPYTATKGGLKMLTQGMCAELGPQGIQVNALAPGYFDTELTSALVNDAEFTAWLTRRAPAGRWGRPEELGGAIVFLCSDAANFVNGQILHVDGGLTAVL